MISRKSHLAVNSPAWIQASLLEALELKQVGCYGENVKKASPTRDTAYYADMLGAMGTEARLQIMRLLLSAHPDGMVVGDILSELKISASTLSHHLDKLKTEDLVIVRRDTRYLWYSANTETLQELLTFLYAECCSRNKAVNPKCLTETCK